MYTRNLIYTGGTTTTMTTTIINASSTTNDSPHVCYKDWRERKICHVFSSSSLGPGHSLMVNASLRQAINPDELKEYCKYPVAEYFECKIPATIIKDNRSCSVECQLREPYDTDYGEIYTFFFNIIILNCI